MQSVFDNLDGDEMRKSRTRSNPFETVRGVFFQNRYHLKTNVKMPARKCCFKRELILSAKLMIKKRKPPTRFFGEISWLEHLPLET